MGPISGGYKVHEFEVYNFIKAFTFICLLKRLNLFSTVLSQSFEFYVFNDVMADGYNITQKGYQVLFFMSACILFKQ